MHVQPVDLQKDTVVCPECHVLQNVDVERHDEESDLLSGQRCWYCGQELRATGAPPEKEYSLVVSGQDVPLDRDAINAWAHDLSQDFGTHLSGFHFDGAGRCLITMKPIHTGADLDLAVD